MFVCVCVRCCVAVYVRMFWSDAHTGFCAALSVYVYVYACVHAPICYVFRQSGLTQLGKINHKTLLKHIYYVEFIIFLGHPNVLLGIMDIITSVYMLNNVRLQIHMWKVIALIM